jgi:hypothetical protein
MSNSFIAKVAAESGKPVSEVRQIWVDTKNSLSKRGPKVGTDKFWQALYKAVEEKAKA